MEKPPPQNFGRSINPNLIQFGLINLIKSTLIWFEPIWSNLIWFDPIWTNFIWFEPNNQFASSWSFLIQFEPIRSNLIQLDLIRSNLSHFIWSNLKQLEPILSDLNFQKWEQTQTWQMARSLSSLTKKYRCIK